MVNEPSITVNGHDFATAFAHVETVVRRHSAKPVLKNVKLRATLTQVTLIATDLEVGIHRRLTDVEVRNAGEGLLPADYVLPILRGLRDDLITVEFNKKQVVIRAEYAEYKLPVEDPADFPFVPEFAGENYIVVQADLLKQMIRRTVFATDADTARYALDSVLMDVNGDNLSLVATDTRRLALTEGKCSKNGNAKAGTSSPLIPKKAMSLIEGSVTDDAGEVHIIVNANDVLISCGSSTIYSRLAEGRFPRYRDLIPDGGEAKIELVAESFYSAVRQAQIITSEESRGVIFAFGLGVMTLYSSVAELGQSRVELPISYGGPEVKINCDARFIADFLRVLEPERTLTMELIDMDTGTRALFRTQDGYTYVVCGLCS